MDPTGIQECGYEWPAGQSQVVKVVVDLSEGRLITDWAAFTLTIREDPGWPRSGATLFVPLDPAIAGGTPNVTATGTVVSATEVTFTFTVPSYPGINRYAFDVWGTGGTAGPVQVFPTTWLTVKPSVMA